MSNNTTIANLGGANGLAASGGSALVGKQLSVGSNLRTQTVSEFIEACPLQISQFSGANKAAQLVNALVEATTSRDGGQGQTVLIPRGEIETTASFNLPNRATIAGANKRGSRIIANASHTGPYMVTVVNGTSSMFDNPLKDLTLDCNNVAGLGGVDSQAWQEGGGLSKVLIQNFRTIGVRIRDGFGGAALLPIDNAEIFASATAVATAGIKMEQISAVGNFVLSVKNTTIAGPAAFPLPRGIDVVKDSTNLETVHFEDCVSGVYLDGVGDHVLENVTGGPGVTNVVQIASTFTGTLTMKGCRRGSATNLVLDNRINGMGTIAWDTDITIHQEPPIGPVAIARGTFNGTTVGSPALTYMRGVSTLTRTSAGLYAVTLSRALPNGNMIAPMVTARHGGNLLAAPDITLTGSASFTIQLKTVGGTAVDSDEIKLAVFAF